MYSSEIHNNKNIPSIQIDALQLLMFLWIHNIAYSLENDVKHSAAYLNNSFLRRRGN